MTRKITTILLALALCLTLLPVGAGAAGTTSPSGVELKMVDGTLKYGSGESYWAVTTNSDPIQVNYITGATASVSGYVLDGGTAGATYTLGEDVTINKPLIIQGGTADNPVTLDLNGKVLKYGGTDKNSVIVVANNAYFTLEDTSSTSHTLRYKVDANGKWTFGTGTDYPNTIDLTGGIITGGTGSDCGYDNSETGRRIEQYYGGGVLVGSGATFNMAGGNIVGCSASSDSAAQMNVGGGVYVAPGSEIGCNTVFHMTGGSIVGCSAQNGTANGIAAGGGVYVATTTGTDNTPRKAEATITNGSIIGCSVFSTNDGPSFAQGGGVYVAGSLTMTAGTISGCTAGQGSGMYCAGGGIIDAQGGSVYGGLYVFSDGLTNTSAVGSTIFYAGTGREAIELGQGTSQINGKLVEFMNGGDVYAETVANADNSGNGNGQISAPVAPTKAGNHFFGWGWEYKKSDNTKTMWDFSRTYAVNNPVMKQKTVNVTVNSRTETHTYETAILTAVWHELNHVDAKDPAAGVKGNIEYWYCDVCNAYFSDENGTKKIDQTATDVPALPHRTYRTTATIESPKTADMGVAIYAVMALTSYTGTALVVRGRKRK